MHTKYLSDLCNAAETCGLCAVHAFAVTCASKADRLNYNGANIGEIAFLEGHLHVSALSSSSSSSHEPIPHVHVTHQTSQFAKQERGAGQMTIAESYLSLRPRRIAIVEVTLGWSTYTCWNRRSRAGSFSMYLRYSSSVVAPMHRSSPRPSMGFNKLPGYKPKTVRAAHRTTK